MRRVRSQFLEPVRRLPFAVRARRVVGGATGAVLTLVLLAAAAPAQAVKPQILDLPVTVEQTTAKLRAQVDPNGLATSYHFEWGEGTAYDHRVPADHDAFVGAGTDPVTITANLAGLDEATIHHFRVVATNGSGTTTGRPDTSRPSTRTA